MTTSAVDPSGAPWRTITRCEVCGGDRLTPVLDLGAHALCDDLVPVHAPRDCARYPISIVWCEACRTAHQRHQVPKRLLFPPGYHYRAALTGDVLRGMRALVNAVESAEGPVAGRHVLDIGCNDGSLLSIFRDRGAVTYGIEPTDAASEARAVGHVARQAFFDPAVAAEFVASHGVPDLVTFTNVFAHIEDLGALVTALRTLAGPATRVVIENHYLGAVLARNQFDTFYHEHPRTYSLTSLACIARTLGMVIARVEFPSRYGGNVRVLLAPEGAAPDALQSPEGRALLDAEDTFGHRLHAMAARVETWRTETRHRLDALVRAHGPLRAKAFPGRAAILIELLGVGTETIRCVHEQPASPKVGHYVPGTRIPIVSDADFEPSDPAPVVNLAWHIHEEITGYLRQLGFAGPVVPVMTAGDGG
jgi:SAM-dependent methyltransferase